MTLKEILQKIGQRHGIDELNAMQKTVNRTKSERIVLIAPTGSGKTLAFAVPTIERLKPDAQFKPQAVVIAPSRELVIQIADVIRPIAKGYKTVAFFGGHPMQDEINSLSVTPDIVVATPGRLLDHLLRGTLDISRTPALVLDEYDKSLELGFHDQMRRIVKRMHNMRFVILTSATPLVESPDFIDLSQAKVIDFTSKEEAPRQRMNVTLARSFEKDKLDALNGLLHEVADGKTIIFVNHRESAERVYNYLKKWGYPVGLYHGGLDQLQREIAIDKLNNGTTPVLVSTDLGSRGLDIEAVRNIVHYHIPPTKESWTHRNGRTARIDNEGNIYLLVSSEEKLPEYVDFDKEIEIKGSEPAFSPIETNVATIYFNAGKKEKLSKTDILGFLVKQSGLTPNEVGKIIVKDHCGLVAVPKLKVEAVLDSVASTKIKGQRIKATLLQ